MIELQPNLELTTAQAERVLAAWLAEPVVCSSIRRLEGGLVNTVVALEFDRPPHHAVMKLHEDGDAFAAEARALRYLRTKTACPVPDVYLHDGSTRLIPYAFLLLEEVPGVCLKGLELDMAARTDIEVQLAEILGELHSHRRTTWGPVDADDSTSWPDLFVARLREAGTHPAVVDRLEPDVLGTIDRAIERATSALRDAGAPTLVHGDVWDGNLMVRLEDGRWRVTGLLDPSLEFADPELELAYLEVFDTPRDDFFAAYAARQPMRDGYERRRLFYWLHTALVHVGLFGDPFFCEFTARTARSIVHGSRSTAA